MRVSTTMLSMTSLEAMLSQQAGLNQTQLRVSTGRNLLSPADDPYGSARILDLQEVVSVNDQYQVNAVFAENRLQLEEGVLAGAGNALQRIRELAVLANNDSQTAESRDFIAVEVDLLLDQIVSLANSTDSNNEYLFAGFQGRTKPFNLDSGTGRYLYAGDDGQRYLRVGSSTEVAAGDDGKQVFMSVRNGNGKYQTNQNVANVGTGIIDPGEVNGAYVPDTYTIRFIPPSNLADPYAPNEYYVLDGLGEVIAPPPPAVPAGTTEAAFLASPAPGIPYEKGAIIQGLDTRGIQLDISGDPSPGTVPRTAIDGDSFTISPSSYEDVFTTIQDLVTTLTSNQTDFQDRAHFHNGMNRALVNIDQAMGNIMDTRAKVGARMNTVDKQTEINESFNLELKKNMSAIEDLDYASAITLLNRQLLGLQAAQNTYTKIQGLSMFNYM